MKFKIVLVSTLVLAILIVAVKVYAFGAVAITVRNYSTPKFTYATALTGSPGLENGTWNVYAKVDDARSDAGSFADEVAFGWCSDYYGDAKSSVKAVANASVCGHDAAGVYQCDHDSDEI